MFKEELTEKELQQVKEQLIGNYSISLEDSQKQMLNLLLYECEGDVSAYYEFEKKIWQKQRQFSEALSVASS